VFETGLLDVEEEGLIDEDGVIALSSVMRPEVATQFKIASDVGSAIVRS